MMDPEDLVDFGDLDDEFYRVYEANRVAPIIFGVPGGGFLGLGRLLRTATPAVVAVPAVASAAKAAAKAAPKVASAAKTAGKTATKKPPAPPVVSPNPIKAIDDAIKKVETPVFIPARITKIWNQLLKHLPSGGVATYFLDKYADMGCADTCPYLGNGEYRLPQKKPPVAVDEPAVAEEPAVAKKEPAVTQREPAVAKKEPAVTQREPAVAEEPAVAKKEPAVAVDKKPAVADGVLLQQTPCFYYEMRERSDDLLFKGYNTGLKLILDCNTDVMLADGRRQAKLEFEASTDTKDIKLSVDHTMNPGIKGVLSLQDPSKAILRYRKPLVSVTGSSELDAWPVVSISAVLGTKSIAWGADISVDTKSLTLSKYSCGLYLSKGEAAASVMMVNDDVLLASYHHKLDEATSIGADLHHTVSSNGSTLTVGCSHVIDPSTMFKAKLSTDGKVCVMLKRSLKPKCYVSVSAESDLNFRGSANGTKFGLCIALGG